MLIAAIMIGFMLFQSKQMEKQHAAQVAEKHRRDSIELVQREAQRIQDSIAQAKKDSLVAAGVISPEEEVTPEEVAPVAAAYQDSLLLKASEAAEAQLVTLENEKIAVTLTTKGGQPYAARVKDYTNYDKSDLYIFNCEANPNASSYNIAIYVNELVNTKDFNFQIAEQTDSSVVMRLPFANGGYIEQSHYTGIYEDCQEIIKLLVSITKKQKEE